MFRKLKDYKRVLVQVADDKTFVPAPPADAKQPSAAQLR